ncbi:unnamed protein product, partial [Prorocentrum cordatum]
EVMTEPGARPGGARCSRPCVGGAPREVPTDAFSSALLTSLPQGHILEGVCGLGETAGRVSAATAGAPGSRGYVCALHAPRRAGRALQVWGAAGGAAWPRSPAPVSCVPFFRLGQPQRVGRAAGFPGAGDGSSAARRACPRRLFLAGAFLPAQAHRRALVPETVGASGLDSRAVLMSQEPPRLAP